MAHYIALLRGVNVAGTHKVPMAELKAVLARRGYANPRTLLASGNVVFETPAKSTAALERALEADLSDALKLKTDVMIRSAAEWTAMIEANPMPGPAKSDASHFLVHVFKTKPDAGKLKAYLETHEGPEVCKLIGREAFVHYPVDVGHSKFSLLKVGSNTGRNWNTVLKLQAMAND